MHLPKPLCCDEQWINMAPVEGGRLCSKCCKTIVDFSKNSWEEIEQIQLANNNSICGYYRRSQLKYWGQEPPSYIQRTKFKVIGLFSIGLLSVFPVFGQNISNPKTVQEINVNSPIKDTLINPLKHKISIQGNVFEVLNTSDSHRLEYVKIHISAINKTVFTDLDGKFEINLSPEDQWYSLNDSSFSIRVSYIGYTTTILENIPINEKSLAYDFELKPNIDINRQGIVFSAAPPTFWQRVKWRFRSVFYFKKRAR